MGRKGSSSRERILKVARKLINERGITGTSLRDLEEESRLSRGSIYYFYKSKEELGKNVLQMARNDFFEFLEESLSGDSAYEKLKNHFSGVVGRQLSRRFVGGCIFGNTAIEMSDRNDDFRLFVRDVFEEWRARLEEVLREGKVSGEFRGDFDEREVSRLLVAAIEGGIMLTKTEKAAEPLEDVLNSVLALLGREGQ